MNRSLGVRRVASWVAQTALAGVIENVVWWGLVSLIVLAAGSGYGEAAAPTSNGRT
jgi:hypothetical protein